MPLLESVILELGRVKDEAAGHKLFALARLEGHPQRAIACLALGASGLKGAVLPLTEALGAGDGFVRLCAYEALKELTKEDHFADWLYGPLAERQAAIEAYRN